MLKNALSFITRRPSAGGYNGQTETGEAGGAGHHGHAHGDGHHGGVQTHQGHLVRRLQEIQGERRGGGDQTDPSEDAA